MPIEPFTAKIQKPHSGPIDFVFQECIVNPKSYGNMGKATSGVQGFNNKGGVEEVIPIKTPKVSGLLTIVLAFFWSLAHAFGATPSTGFVSTFSYSLDKTGNTPAEQDRQETRIWFSGNKTRTEIWNKGELSLYFLDDIEHWTVFPRLGRILKRPGDLGRASKSYTKGLVADLAKIANGKFPNAVPYQDQGYKSWWFSIDNPERQLEHFSFAAIRQDYWFLADPDFPVLLKYTDNSGNQKELKELRRDVPVANELFEKPKDLKTTLPVSLPPNGFVMEVEEERRQKQTKERSVESKVYTNNGTKTIETYRRTDYDAEDKITKVFTAPPKTWPSGSKSNDWFLVQMLQIEWTTVTGKIGQQKLPLGDADIYAGYDVTTPKQFWVIDDPVWGSIVARWQIDNVSETTTFRIKALNYEKGYF